MITAADIDALTDDMEMNPAEWLLSIDMHPDALDDLTSVALSLHVEHVRAGVPPWLSVFGMVALSLQIGWVASIKHGKEGRAWPVI